MIPAQFDYVRPGDLDEALRILTDREGEAKLLSGGYSLIPLIKLRLAQPALLVDLRDVDRPRRHRRDRRLTCASAPGRPIARSTRRDVVRDHYPLLHDVTGDDRRPAGPQLGHDRRLGRPRRPGLGLAGGRSSRPTRRSSAAARPASARSRPATSSSTRSPTAIEPTEVLTEIRIPRRPRASGGALREARAQGRRLRDGRRRRGRPARRRRHDRARRHRRHRASPTRRSRRPTPRPILVGNAAVGGAVPRRPARPPARRAGPPPTSADPSTTSGRWPPR